MGTKVLRNNSPDTEFEVDLATEDTLEDVRDLLESRVYNEYDIIK